MKDYYYILGVNEAATPVEITKAYRELSKKFHPDLNNGSQYFENLFKNINEAYEVIGDEKLRKKYDRNRINNPQLNDEHNEKHTSIPEIIKFSASNYAMGAFQNCLICFSTVE